ncbi:helix-turn-helix transcriptional regulator [Photobacterium makurazakiensis]|uniref:helix-turn-helix domain-containing protein n=1 Tax=Photobacterium makurazakiensis TaxID=2910234 RepID=UPI003D0E2F94
MTQARQFLPQLVEQLPTSVFIHYFDIAAGTETLAHQHEWGQIHLIKSGVLEMEVAGRKMVSPAGYAIWTPPRVQHKAYNRRDIEYCAINVCVSMVGCLPEHACMITLTPLVQAIIDDLIERQVGTVDGYHDQCLTEVLLARLATAHTLDNFLPTTAERLIQPILQALENDPADERTLADWAKIVYSTERTLNRRFQRELKMNFNEWRQRLKVVHALRLLKQSNAINEVAFQLGYSQASSFIKMFRRQMGMTPEAYRQQLLS